MTASKNSTQSAAPAVVSPQAALWRMALNDYEREVAAYSVVEAEYSARMAEVEALDLSTHYASFRRFRLINLHYREENMRLVVGRLLCDRAAQDPDTERSHADTFELLSEAALILADYAKTDAELHEAVARIYGDIEERHDAAVNRVSDARDKLVASAAPDATALAYKLDVLGAYLEECDSEDKQYLAAISSDARRLLGVV